ncbi:hypothetical protein D3C83_38550 [compost metagenome]
MIELISPIGHPRIEAQARLRRMDTPVGRRLGYIWNQYQTTRNFWPRLERAVEALCKPPVARRAYKSNTWTPLDPAQFGELAAAVDYLVIGVGA